MRVGVGGGVEVGDERVDRRDVVETKMGEGRFGTCGRVHGVLARARERHRRAPRSMRGKEGGGTAQMGSSSAVVVVGGGGGGGGEEAASRFFVWKNWGLRMDFDAI